MQPWEISEAVQEASALVKACRWVEAQLQLAQLTSRLEAQQLAADQHWETEMEQAESAFYEEGVSPEELPF